MFSVMQEMLLSSCQSVEKEFDKMDSAARTANIDCISNAVEEFVSLSKQKKEVSRSLALSINFYLNKFRGYIAEFRHEVDLESPCTSMDIEKSKFCSRD